MSIHGQMVEVTRRIAREGIGKTRNNQQQGYKFRGVDEVMNAFAPILADAGLFLRPRFMERDCAERVTAKGSPLFYVTVKGEFDFANDAGEIVTVGPFYGEAMDTADKATNKAMAVAFKYAMFQTFCVPLEGVTGGDADAMTHDVAVQTITEAQEATLRDTLEGNGKEVQACCAYFGVDKLSALPADKYASAIKIAATPKAKAA